MSEQLVIEKGSICDKATECAINLKQMKDEICFAKAKEIDVNQKVGMSHIVGIQKQMNFIFVNKMNQQHNFFEKQDKKEKELATTVKWSKIDTVTYSGT